MFILDSDNGIQWVDGDKLLDLPDNVAGFDSESDLQTVADRLEFSREKLEEIWNEFAGTPKFSDLKPVVKFRNRPFGVKRIWWAIQRLRPDYKEVPEAEMPDWVKPKKPAEEKEPVKAKSKAKSKTPAKRERGDSKKHEAARLMLRASGVTESELKERLGWSEGSVNMFAQWVSFVSGTGIKKLSVEKNRAGDRVYKAA